MLSIARRFNIDVDSMLRANGLRSARVRTGARLIIPKMHILPALADNAVVLNVPERALYVFRNSELVCRYPVAIGMRGWQTPTGRFRIVRKVKDPVWITPEVMVRREGVKKRKIMRGRDNPIGDRWIGWSRPEVGFHTTFAVETVGRLASHACVRLYPESAHHLFDQVKIGMPILSEYETIKLGQRDGRLYLTVLPDVYRMRRVTMERIERRLADLGVLKRVEMQRLKRIEKRQDGRAWCIAKLPQAQTSNSGKDFSR
jgi:L,D-transpeptidase ErfK/SrfK